MTLRRRAGALARPEIVSAALVGALVAWNAWSLRFVLHMKFFDNDAAMHELMVRTLVQLLRAHRFPLNAWFPFFGLGSQYFMNYQSLGALVTAIPGLWIGPLAAFNWATYFLMAFWPLAVYVAARVMDLGRKTSTVAALAAPFLSSVPGVGLEVRAWLVWGLWAQLWAAWMLPFAWAFAFRAVANRRFVLPSVLFISLTVAVHFESGYLALGFPLLLAVIFLRRDGRTAVRMALVSGLSLGVASWVIIPLLMRAKWKATDVVLAQTTMARGYGAAQNLHWLISGQLFDYGRLPVITPFVLVGAIASGVNWKTSAASRAVLSVFVASLVLSFGPTTWGVIADLVPGHGDIYFRRFIVGVHLAGLLLAGYGFVWLVERCYQGLRRAADAVCVSATLRRAILWIGSGAAMMLAGLWTGPARSQLSAAYGDGAALNAEWAGMAQDAHDLSEVAAYISQRSGGRTYVYRNLSIGPMPAYIFMEDLQLDQVYTPPYAHSLMTYVGLEFNPTKVYEYPVFGVKYLVVGAAERPAVHARKVFASGPYAVWRVGSSGFASLVYAAGSISENRTTVSAKARGLLQSPLLQNHEDLLVSWDGTTSESQNAKFSINSPPGSVISESVKLAAGEAQFVVNAERGGFLLFSVSYDPGWHVWIDGHPGHTVMLAPALLGVKLPAGRHEVEFRFVGYQWYPLLFALGLVAFAGAAYVSMASEVPWFSRGRRRTN